MLEAVELAALRSLAPIANDFIQDTLSGGSESSSNGGSNVTINVDVNAPDIEVNARQIQINEGQEDGESTVSRTSLEVTAGNITPGNAASGWDQ